MQLIRACVVRSKCVALGVVWCSSVCGAQLLPQPALETLRDTTERSGITYGVTRVGFTSVVQGDATVQQQLWLGQLILMQRYRGTSLLTQVQSFRDDESLRLEHRITLADSLAVFPRVEWDVASDSRSLGISRLERLRLAGGGSYRTSIGRVEAFAGIERAEQLSVQEAGVAVGALLQSAQYRLGELSLAARSSAELVTLRVRRNADVAVQVTLSSGPAAPPFELQLEHRRQGRDYYTTLGLTSALALEHRTEERWTASVVYQQQLGSWLVAMLSADANLGYVERFFDAPDATSSLTYVRRRLREFQGGVQLQLEARLGGYHQLLGMLLREREESNVTLDRFPAPSPQLVEEVRVSERMRDNITHRGQLWTRIEWATGRGDTVGVAATIGIVHFDTPSPLNYDDRDELTTTAQLFARRLWSAAIASYGAFEYAAVHFVFLPAQRSALSNWNRTFRLSHSLQLRTTSVQWQPTVELLAQYTSYDFEGLSGVPTSFSFRQLAYRDSLAVALGDYTLEAQAYLRWFLRGDFSWARFAERPSGSGREYFVRGMVWHRFSEAVELGWGMRWYALEQSMSGSSFAVLASSLHSIAPEAAVQLAIDAVEVLLSGWCELRTLVAARPQLVPNLQLSVRRRL